MKSPNKGFCAIKEHKVSVLGVPFPEIEVIATGIPPIIPKEALQICDGSTVIFSTA